MTHLIQTLIDLPALDLPRRCVKTILPAPYAKVRDSLRERSRYRNRRDAALWHHQLQLILAKIIAHSGLRIQHGPFAGMLFWPVGLPGYAAGGLASSLLGLYELELHSIFERIIRKQYKQVIDIGCAQGYYAVGIAMRLPQTRVYAFDIESMARNLCAALAEINNVSEHVIVQGECTLDTLRTLTTEPGLILSDCEGAELDLLRPDAVPALSNCDVLVELHEILRPGLTKELLARFETTHRIEIIDTAGRRPEDYPQLHFLSREEIQIALDERRPAAMQWAYMVSRSAQTTPA